MPYPPEHFFRHLRWWTRLTWEGQPEHLDRGIIDQGLVASYPAPWLFQGDGHTRRTLPLPIVVAPGMGLTVGAVFPPDFPKAKVSFGLEGAEMFVAKDYRHDLSKEAPDV